MEPGQESITLYCTTFSVTKEFNADLMPSPEGEGWVVRFEHGRLGGVFDMGTKTPRPVVYSRAKKAYDKLVALRIAEGYSQRRTFRGPTPKAPVAHRAPAARPVWSIRGA